MTSRQQTKMEDFRPDDDWSIQSKRQ